MADDELTFWVGVTHGGGWEGEDVEEWRGVAALQPRVVTLHLGRGGAAVLRTRVSGARLGDGENTVCFTV